MDTSKTIAIKFGFYVSIMVNILTIITFGLALFAVPSSGPNCIHNCMEYPFQDLLLLYPRDYYWMYVAMFQLCAFLIFIITVHYTANVDKKLFSLISVAFALISTSVLLVNYFIQFTVVPISIRNGESEGIPLMTQYNGHGIFIALEELGFMVMSIALFFLAPVFSPNNKLYKMIRWALFLPLLLNIAFFILYSIQFGIDRNYRFEVASITINWLFLIIASALISIHFKRLLDTN